MKNFWTLAMVGVFLTVLFGAVVKASNDSKNEPAEKRLQGQGVQSKDFDNGIKEKAQALEEREKRVRESEERLAVEDERVRARIADLNKLLTDLKDIESKKLESDKKALAKLVKTYETMQPKKAANVISTMGDDLAAEILSQMKEKKVASILESMESNRAMKLSSILARRKPAAEQELKDQPQENKGPEISK
jgi:flagellar motility protein MotE (MotC chaperone)